MFRQPRRLARKLEDLAKNLERFIQLDQNGTPSLPALMPADQLAELKGMIESIKNLDKPLEQVVDSSIHNLSAVGMNMSPVTGKIENIFASHQSSKLQDEGKYDSQFHPEENFGEVIKKAFGIDFASSQLYDAQGMPTTTLTGAARSQAHFEKLAAYEDDVKKLEDSRTQFMRDLISLRVGHNLIANPASTIPRLIDVIQKDNQTLQAEMAEMRIGGQLHGLVRALRDEAKNIRRVNQYNQLMTADDFTHMIPVSLRGTAVVQVKEKLTLLQPKPVTFLSGIRFWSSKPVKELSPEERFQHLAELQILVQKVHGTFELRGDYDRIDKKNFTKLRNQIDYALVKESAKINVTPALVGEQKMVKGKSA